MSEPKSAAVALCPFCERPIAKLARVELKTETDVSAGILIQAPPVSVFVCEHCRKIVGMAGAMLNTSYIGSVKIDGSGDV